MFVPGMEPGAAVIPLPPDEVRKLRNVLRLRTGDEIAVLPNDGTVARCRLQGHQAEVLSIESPETEPDCSVTLATAFCRAETLEESVRMSAELGVSRILLFPSDRSVVRWSGEKLVAKVNRLRAIAREACEVAFRVRLPEVDVVASLDELLRAHPEALVLSESEDVQRRLTDALPQAANPVLVIGPEGGWSPAECTRIADRAVTLGPRVLRADTAAVCAVTLALYLARP